MKLLSIALLTVGIGSAQPKAFAPVIVDPTAGSWSHDKTDAPGLDLIFIREDAQTHGMEMFVRFPAGHVVAPHSHDSNERIMVVRGQLTLGSDEGDRKLEVGAFAFLPATQLQRLSCSSTTPCVVYLAWDGSPKSHPASPK